MPVVWRSQLGGPVVEPDVIYDFLRKWAEAKFSELALPKSWEDFSWAGLDGRTVFTLVDLEPPAGELVLVFRLQETIARQRLRWTTDITLHVGNTGTVATVSLSRDAVAGVVPVLDSTRIVPPRFFTDLVGVLGDGSISTSHAYHRDQAEAESLLRWLENPHRWVPAVVVSEDDDTERAPVSVEELTEALRGIATVHRLSKAGAREFSSVLAAHGLGKQDVKRWGVFDGAIRIYLPRLDLKQGSPFEHPLYLRWEAARQGTAEEIIEWCQREAAHFAFAPYRTFNEIRLGALVAKAASHSGSQDSLAQELNQLLDTEREEWQAKESGYLKERASLQARLDGLQQQLRVVSEAEQSDSAHAFGASTTIRYYKKSNGKRPALDFAEDLPGDAADAALRGLSQLPEALARKSFSFVEKVRGGKPNQSRAQLWEYKVNTAKDLWLRFFFARSQDRDEVLLLHGYAKKQNDLDDGEVEKAAKLLEDAWEQGWK